MITTSTRVSEFFGAYDSYQLVRDRSGFTVNEVVWPAATKFPRIPVTSRLAWFAAETDVERWMTGRFESESELTDAHDVLHEVEYTWNGEGPEFGPDTEPDPYGD